MARPTLLWAVLAIACEQSLEIGSVSVSVADPNHDVAPPLANGGAAGGPASPGVAPGAGSGGAEIVPMPPLAGAPDSAGAAGEDVLWSSSVESGDTRDWTGDGAASGGEQLHAASLQASSERAHSGSYSVKISFDTSDHQNHWAELYRQIASGSAYYSAWFYLEAAHAPAVYWTLFNFFSETTPGELATRRGLWDLNLNAHALYFYDEGSGQFADAVPALAYPIGRWFQLEVLLDLAPPSASHLSVWQDGTLVLERSQLQSPSGATLYFGVGSQTDQLSPPDCTLYIDDVTISRQRIGP
jgi:hypothetical protein